jgi:hypothetical protein
LNAAAAAAAHNMSSDNDRLIGEEDVRNKEKVKKETIIHYT